MRTHTTICQVDVGQSLNDLKEDMLYSLDFFKHRENNRPVYGIFNGDLYVAYPCATSIDDIKRY